MAACPILKGYVGGEPQGDQGEHSPMDEQQNQTSGVIEVDLFPEDVNRFDHPQALEFRALLEEVAADYGCSLVAFEVRQGTVVFAFDDDVLTAEILRELEMDYGS